MGWLTDLGLDVAIAAATTAQPTHLIILRRAYKPTDLTRLCQCCADAMVVEVEGWDGGGFQPQLRYQHRQRKQRRNGLKRTRCV